MRLAAVNLIFLLATPVAFAQDAGAIESPWTMGLIASMLALALGGAAAVLGLWIGRDKERPIGFALAMTVLITATIGVGIVQSYLDAEDGVQKRADLSRMMTMVKEIAINTGDLELAKLIEEEGGGAVDMPEEEPEAEGDTGEEGEAGEDGEEATDGEEGEEATDGEEGEAPAEGEAGEEATDGEE